MLTVVLQLLSYGGFLNLSLGDSGHDSIQCDLLLEVRGCGSGGRGFLFCCCPVVEPLTPPPSPSLLPTGKRAAPPSLPLCLLGLPPLSFCSDDGEQLPGHRQWDECGPRRLPVCPGWRHLPAGAAPPPWLSGRSCTVSHVACVHVLALDPASPRCDSADSLSASNQCPWTWLTRTRGRGLRPLPWRPASVPGATVALPVR